jgi:hypothetical protein
MRDDEGPYKIFQCKKHNPMNERAALLPSFFYTIYVYI